MRGQEETGKQSGGVWVQDETISSKTVRRMSSGARGSISAGSSERATR